MNSSQYYNNTLPTLNIHQKLLTGYLILTTSTFKSYLSDYTYDANGNILASMIDDYNAELEEINNITNEIYRPKVDEISSNNELLLQCLHDEFYHSFCDESTFSQSLWISFCLHLIVYQLHQM